MEAAASQLEQVREKQRESWNKFSSGWKKWDQLTMDFLRPVGIAILDSIPWKDNFKVLDVASGTGEPGLSAASIVKNGKVTATDLAEDMVAIAAENGRLKGLTNFEAIVAGVDALPFEDESFDAVICRNGVMFFPDISKGVAEIRRVLKPGGYFSAAFFVKPEKNQWATLTMDIINKYVEMPAPAPHAPGLFRCARPGFMKEILQQAGFTNVQEKEISFSFNAPSIETYWDFNTQVAAPVVMGLSKADASTKEKIRNEVVEKASQYLTGSGVSLPAMEAVICGQK
jgi:ubiquinone/menaquinone biosynthesis C-methylase UbiE